MTDLTISNFNDFVMLAGDQIVTDSRRVAARFGKQHSKVLRDIRRISEEAGSDFAKANFGFCTEASKTQRGKPQPFYRITKDGFMLLAMGFTGKTAMAVKVMFISAFNSMAYHIKRQATSAWDEYRAVAIEFAKCKDTASLCGKGLSRWRRLKPNMTARLDALEHQIQPSLLLN